MIGVGGGAGNPYYLQNHQQLQLFHHGHALDAMDGGGGGFMADSLPAPAPPDSAADAQSHALLYNLSVLRDKVQQLQPFVGLALAHGGPGDAAAPCAVIQDIIAAASSMMYAFQQLCGGHGGSSSVVVSAGRGNNGRMAVAAATCGEQQQHHHHQAAADIDHQHQVMQQWQHQHRYGSNNTTTRVAAATAMPSSSSHPEPPPTTTMAVMMDEEEEDVVAGAGAVGVPGTVIELEAAELLAKYTHYCQVCGKGFKRDANLRMHMRAHGDEYKSSAALANPAKQQDGAATTTARSLYSCPQEGCRWNRKHAKFQPLKSVICAKNHYKRSHCPKMYVCNRCNRKHFSVLSDLRTHEKHCGDHRWLCSCGTSFSRKDKLVGHLALFAGHQPAVPLANGGGRRSSSSLSKTTQHQLGT